MKTYIPKKTENRKWHILDAKWLVLWKIATKVATILRWKDKATYAPHMDNGDFVIITNCDKFILTWNKMQDKKYYRHSQYAKNGLKTITAEKVMEKDPTFVLNNAVAWMISNNKLKKWMLMRLKLYAWEDHEHGAQKPETLSI